MIIGISPIEGLVKFKELTQRLQKHPELLKHKVVCCVRATAPLQNLAENTVNCWFIHLGDIFTVVESPVYGRPE